MDKRDHVLSGEEALDEYFTALLEEESAEEFELESLPSEPVAEYDQKRHEENAVQEVEALMETSSAYSSEEQVLVPEAKLQPDFHSSYTELEYNEFEVPALEDVQRLLDRLETTDFAADASSIMEKNTEEIAKSVTEVEEIQDWDVAVVEEIAEEAAEALVEEPAPEVDVIEAQATDVTEEVIIEQEVELETQSGGLDVSDWESTERSEDFQVLYFEVSGVTFAVPLDELGGIHKIGDMSHLIGRPDWYLGLQTNKDDQLDVVDTAKWVMSDRLTDDSHKEGYQYVVMLSLSNWGLASTELKGTETLNTDKVNWRTLAGKRPWLAGMVREKMCALIHVEALVKMLNAGLDVKSLDR